MTDMQFPRPESLAKTKSDLEAHVQKDITEKMYLALKLYIEHNYVPGKVMTFTPGTLRMLHGARYQAAAARVLIEKLVEAGWYAEYNSGAIWIKDAPFKELHDSGDTARNFS